MIAAGWDVLDANFNVAAFKRWREMALECLTELVEPDHTYTQYFNDYSEPSKRRMFWQEKGFSFQPRMFLKKPKAA